MNSKCTVIGAALAAMAFALAPGAVGVAAAADGPSGTPSPLPTQAYASIDADSQINVGATPQSATVTWSFGDDGASVPLPTNISLVIDARGLAGVASVSVDDPRCTADGQVFTCVNKDVYERASVDFTLRRAPNAVPGDHATLKYAVTADHATGATGESNVVVGVPKLLVGRTPDVTDAEIGSRIDLPLQLRNTGDLATDRRLMLRWESVGGLVFDRKYSNCSYGGADDPGEPDGRTSVTCLFPVGPDSVPAGGTVQLSSPLTATVGKHVLTAVTDYSAELLAPGVQPGGGTEQGTGPALTLVRASGTGNGFEDGAKGRFTVAADNSADLAATATTKPRHRAGEWALDINAVNHGPGSVYGVDGQSAVVVDVVVPKDVTVIGTAYDEGEDTPYGPCKVQADDDRHYLCTVPLGLPAGKSQLFELWVRTAKGYDGAKGTATVRPGPAGIPVHDPDASDDGVTFAFATSTATPTPTAPTETASATAAPATTAPSDGGLASTGAGRTALIATAAGSAVLLGGAVLVAGRRRRGSH
ncbi:hypothetical protein ABZT17_38925 [Streptomyces sp. NPDC005648]|uniref:hypothetical protein n=1 Tax=Streptomyces sp. NPDC005648 TaxID=3157044 RepID=UPI0033A8D673